MGNYINTFRFRSNSEQEIPIKIGIKVTIEGIDFDTSKYYAVSGSDIYNMNEIRIYCYENIDEFFRKSRLYELSKVNSLFDTKVKAYYNKKFSGNSSPDEDFNHKLNNSVVYMGKLQGVTFIFVNEGDDKYIHKVISSSSPSIYEYFTSCETKYSKHRSDMIHKNNNFPEKKYTIYRKAYKDINKAYKAYESITLIDIYN